MIYKQLQNYLSPYIFAFLMIDDSEIVFSENSIRFYGRFQDFFPKFATYFNRTI